MTRGPHSKGVRDGIQTLCTILSHFTRGISVVGPFPNTLTSLGNDGNSELAFRSGFWKPCDSKYLDWGIPLFLMEYLCLNMLEFYFIHIGFSNSPTHVGHLPYFCVGWGASWVTNYNFVQNHVIVRIWDYEWQPCLLLYSLHLVLLECKFDKSMARPTLNGMLIAFDMVWIHNVHMSYAYMPQ